MPERGVASGLRRVAGDVHEPPELLVMEHVHTLATPSKQATTSEVWPPPRMCEVLVPNTDPPVGLELCDGLAEQVHPQLTAHKLDDF